MGEFLRAFAAGLSGRAGKPPVPKPRPVGCTACGLTFASQSAYTCHIEELPEGKSRCMPPSRLEGALLTVRDGVWCLPGFER